VAIKFEWKYVWDYFPQVLAVLPQSLLLVGVSAIIGLVAGIIIAIVRIERVPVFSQIAAVMVSFIRGTPIIIQMFIVYLGLPLLLSAIGIKTRFDKMFFVYITFGLNVSGFLSEVIRSSILSIDASQWDAAKSVGHNKFQTYIRIILPQSVVVAIPSVGMTLTGLLQDSSLTVAMGVVDIIGKAQTLGAQTKHTFEGYVVAGIIFITLSVLIEVTFAYIAKKSVVKRSIVK
jgi:L-cystine transport system permease protein